MEKIMIDMWYGEYRGNIWKGGRMIGDYVCADSVALENLFPQLKFAW